MHVIKVSYLLFVTWACSKKNRRSVGTRGVCCEAAIHLRLLRIARGMEILEVKVPMGTAHSHDLSSVADQICLKPLQQLEAKVSELVHDSLLNQRALRMALKTWVDNDVELISFKGLNLAFPPLKHA